MAGTRLTRALASYVAVAFVVAVWFAAAGWFVGLAIFDVSAVLGVAAIAFGVGGWVVRKLRGRGPNPVELWARRRGLPYSRQGRLPEALPLLCRGDSRAAVDVVTGELAPGIDGVLGRYTYFVKRGDERRPYRYTVAVTGVPESVAFAPFLLCRHKRSARGGDDAPDDTYADRRTVELESAKLRADYEIETWADQDPVWVRELFSPTLIAWLGDRAPERLSFEVTDGALCVALPGHDHDPATLDGLVAAAEQIARRLRHESLEEEGRPAAAVAASGGRSAARLRARVDRVRWSEPPPDAAAAARPYRRVAAREPGLWLQALGAGAVVTAAVYGGGPEESGGELGSLVVSGAIGFVATLLAARALVRVRARRWGVEAFVREYARSRGLDLRSGRRFHAEHVRLPLPGMAEHAMHGRLGDARLRGDLVLATDRTNRRDPVHYAVLVVRTPRLDGVPWLRVEPADVAGRRADFRLWPGGGAGTRLDRLEQRLERRYVVTAAPGSDEAVAERLFPDDVADALAAGGAGAYSVTLRDGDVAVFRQAPAPQARSAGELDRFSVEAAEITARLERAAARAAGSGPGLARA